MSERPIALDLPPAEPLPEDVAALFAKCVEKLGFVPNVLAAHAFSPVKLRLFNEFYNDLMLAPGALTKLERELIAVAVSSANHCFYCLTAHGAAVRRLSKSPVLGEQMVMNYRAARLDPRRRAMLDFAHKLTVAPAEIDDPDRDALRAAGFSEEAIWEIASVTGFFNMSNRLAAATDMRPNPEYHNEARHAG